MMAMLYASKICMGRKPPRPGNRGSLRTFLPSSRRRWPDVLINECGLPELVPASTAALLNE